MDLLQKLNAVPKENTSIPFWSWNNTLSDDELIRQMDEMRRAEIFGFIMHARTGLKEEYLGENWFHKIELCLDYAKAHDMQAWIYDENGWPSGFAGGLLLQNPDFRAQSLVHTVSETFDPKAFCAFVIESGVARRVKQEKNGTQEYHLIYLKTDASNTDILNPELVDSFLAVTHEAYYARFSQRFGRELAGFFTDEPQYFRWGVPYSRYAAAEYKQQTGEDIREGLIHLFLTGADSDAFRIRYYDILNKLFNENFYKKIYDWCKSHNCLLTGHAIEESRLYAQMWGCAGIMGSYQYEHIPGIDWLGRGIDCGIAPKQASSVAAQTGKKFILTETFGCSGWDTTPRELKWIAEFQYVGGVNKMCQHLSAYSLKGQGKNDHPPSFSRHNLWYTDGYEQFNRYFNRLGYLLSMSQECVDTLLLSPIRSLFPTYDRQKDYQSVREVDDAFTQSVRELESHGLNYHMGEEGLLTSIGSTDGGVLKLGNCSYTQVIVPYATVLSEKVKALLNAFARAGGRLVVDPRTQLDICGNTTIDSLYQNNAFKPYLNETAPVMGCMRRVGNDRFYYVLNTQKDAPVTLKMNCDYQVADLLTLSAERGSAELSLPAMGSAVLLLSEHTNKANRAQTENCMPSRQVEQTEMVDKLQFVQASENCLKLDFVSFSRNGAAEEGPYYVHQAAEKLIRAEYEGALKLKYTFTAQYVPQRAKLLLEKLDGMTVSVNGVPLQKDRLTQSDWDIEFLSADVSGLLQTGKNEVLISLHYFQKPVVKYALFDPNVTESVKNCLTVDTEIESIYVQGDFCVNDRFELVAPSAPVCAADLQKQGFAFFNGLAEFTLQVTYASGKAELLLDGRYMTAKIFCGDKCVQSVLNQRVDVTPILTKGENQLRIVLSSSARNMMGPHHFAPADDLAGVNPFMFTQYGHWEKGVSPFFTPEYKLVSFGLNSVLWVVTR